jgi:hypothetical protein
MLARGVEPIAVTSLPANFAINARRAPAWLNEGREIAVFGVADQKSLILGFGGPQFSEARMIAEDFSAAAPHGRLLDVAVSPDGMTIASLVAIEHENQVRVIDRAVVDSGPGRPLASLDGSFDTADLSWTSAGTLAVNLGGHRPAAAQLYMIEVQGQPQIRSLDHIRCALTDLSFSPDGQWAVAQGDHQSPSYLISLHDQACVAIDREPIRVLAWAPDSSSFLYIAQGLRPVTGVFRYERTSGRRAIIAISSGAAAYASDGAIVALGSSGLSWKSARDFPHKMIELQMARWLTGQQEIQINSVGIETLPPMLAQASMLLSTASDEGVIDLLIPSPQGPQRELIGYSYPTRATYLIASGRAGAPLAMSWSPDGKLLAIVDGGVHPAVLMVVSVAA